MTCSKAPALGDPAAALALLSRLPVRADHARGAAASWAWPFAGLILGALAAATGQLALRAGLPAPMAAGAVLAAGIVITGAMHEDGLADSADGLWGGWTPARRLEIMKDSRIGAYGVLALIVVLGLRWLALAALLQGAGAFAAIAAIGAISRLPMVWIAGLCPPARPSGMAAMTGAPGLVQVALATVLTLAAALLLLGSGGLLALSGAGLAAFWLARLALRRIGGQTGDILGASQQLAEIAGLSVLVALGTS
ncbi:adenosylcobinamide-GDP ribazoletransferase [Profundibacterium mesophilum]|uniref:Adenosylcobinamide-GDP ribazoletransferase n=1 Tax=Profundibacterium mesophilum KAUST100406-0324 TaxID=1037889 RepID=A0A921NT07_9RHOB|nr:adenosylcobinamide-GDP ribazoletransferase [Profundibacterium mesophilum]KAF0674965.1 Cobalamin synthase [Profundibacterium mesophilum KAUST100406-0324]